MATRQDSFVLSRPSFQFATVQSLCSVFIICVRLLTVYCVSAFYANKHTQIYRASITGNFEIEIRVETRQNFLVLFPVVFTPPTQSDKIVLSCPCRRCERAIRGSTQNFPRHHYAVLLECCMKILASSQAKQRGLMVSA